MLKTIKMPCDLKTHESLVSMAAQLELEILQIEGVLNDTYLIYNEGEQQIKLKRYKPRKYILLSHEYRNSQSNDLYVIMTDDDTIAGDYERAYYNMPWRSWRSKK